MGDHFIVVLVIFVSVIVVFVMCVMLAARGRRLGCRRVRAEATGLPGWMVGRRVLSLVGAANDSQSGIRLLVRGISVGGDPLGGIGSGVASWDSFAKLAATERCIGPRVKWYGLNDRGGRVGKRTRAAELRGFVLIASLPAAHGFVARCPQSPGQHCFLRLAAMPGAIVRMMSKSGTEAPFPLGTRPRGGETRPRGRA